MVDGLQLVLIVDTLVSVIVLGGMITGKVVVIVNGVHVVETWQKLGQC